MVENSSLPTTERLTRTTCTRDVHFLDESLQLSYFSRSQCRDDRRRTQSVPDDTDPEFVTARAESKSESTEAEYLKVASSLFSPRESPAEVVRGSRHKKTTPLRPIFSRSLRNP